jgi:hypothetical protein
MPQPDVTPLANTTHERDATGSHTVKHGLSDDAQEVCLATTFDDLLGEDDATDETADDIIRAVQAWRAVTSSRSLD